MNKVFAFDFDGVLSESLLEAYLITWRISGAVLDGLGPAADEELPGLDTIHAFRDRHRSHWERFSAIVPFGNRCEDYLVIQSAVREGRALTTQKEFDSYRVRFEPWLEAFHAKFYEERYAMVEHSPAQWLALNQPYPGIPEALEALSRRFRLAIATSKDGRSVTELLAAYGVAGLFPAEAILDKSAGESKRAHLTALSRLFGCGCGDICFIDDKVNHLIDCAPLGVQCYLAGWGYNGAEEHRAAVEHGFAVLDVTTLAQLTP